MPKSQKTKEPSVCFAIMPISDPDEYTKGHFKRVYDNIIKESCAKAGFKAIRADDVKTANFIHIDILNKLLDAPLAICDLSSRNPNVLFELGIRQAFDKPVVLIQEKGTPKIFDIGPLRVLEYSREMRYHEVLETQEQLKATIESTMAAKDDETNVNSIVKLLSLNGPAQIPDLGNNKEGMAIEVLHAEVKNIRSMMENLTLANAVQLFNDKIQTHPECKNLEFNYDTASHSTKRYLINRQYENYSSRYKKLLNIIQNDESKLQKLKALEVELNHAFINAENSLLKQQIENLLARIAKDIDILEMAKE